MVADVAVLFEEGGALEVVRGEDGVNVGEDGLDVADGGELQGPVGAHDRGSHHLHLQQGSEVVLRMQPGEEGGGAVQEVVERGVAETRGLDESSAQEVAACTLAFLDL